MMKFMSKIVVMLVLAVLLAACGGDDTDDTTVAVAVALTQTAVAQVPDSAPAEAAVETAVTAIPAPAEATPIPVVTTQPDPPADPPDAPTATVPDCVNDAEFVTDVTIPDNSEIQFETTFDKVWTMRNTGTCTWTQGLYGVQFVDGNDELEAQSISIPAVDVLPGGETNVTITFRAPYLAGNYISGWQMESPEQRPFGDSFYVIIEVPQTDDNEPLTEVPGYGVIRGGLAFPAEGIPAMTVYFQDVNSPETMFNLQTGEGWSAYENELPAGDYYVFARVTGDNSGLGGGYTAAVPCGLTVDCTDHSMLAITIEEGKLIENIDMSDWYAPEGTFPFP